MWYKSSARKPYYALGQSMKRFFSEPVRFLKESNTIESAFEKPYLDDSYNKMHLRWSVPDWHFGFDPRDGAQGPLSQCWAAKSPFCQVQCFRLGPTVSRCQLVGGYSSDGIGLGVSVFGGASGGLEEGGPGQPGFFNAPTVDIHHTSSDECSEDFEVGAKFSWLEPMCVTNYPKKCTGSVRVFCNACGDPPVLLADYGTCGETTSQQSSDWTETFCVIGGVPPFTWVGTNNLSFATSETTGRSNVGTIPADSCGTAVAQITDNCGQDVEYVMRIIGGGRFCLDEQCLTCSSNRRTWSLSEGVCRANDWCVIILGGSATCENTCDGPCTNPTCETYAEPYDVPPRLGCCPCTAWVWNWYCSAHLPCTSPRASCP